MYVILKYLYRSLLYTHTHTHTHTYIHMEFCKHFLLSEIVSEWNHLRRCMIIHLKAIILMSGNTEVLWSYLMKAVKLCCKDNLQ